MMNPDCESGDNKQISEQEAIEILIRMREKISAPYVRAALRIGIENIKVNNK